VLIGAREVLAMVDEDEKQNSRSCSSAPDPAFSNIKTEYDHLCEELGGPVDLGPRVSQIDFRRYCREHPSHQIVPVLRDFNPDKPLVRRLWPWAAFALGQYIWEQKERETYGDEPTPTELEGLLSQIAQSARLLNSGLCQLQKLSYRLPDPNARLRRGHLAWLDTFISQAVAGIPSNAVTENAHDLAHLHEAKLEFFKRLGMIEATALRARERRLDKDLLQRKRGQTNPALSRPCVLLQQNLEKSYGANAKCQQGGESQGFRGPGLCCLCKKACEGRRRCRTDTPPSRNSLATYAPLITAESFLKSGV
jgi:hypothetical protein